MNNYNGGATDASQGPTPNSELAIAETEHTTIQSHLLNSIYTHKSARYAIEGMLG